MIAKWLVVSMKRSGKASLCWMLDWSLFYEPPFTFKSIPKARIGKYLKEY